MRARLPHRPPGTQRGPGSALSRPDPGCQTVTDQVADVGQVLVGEDGLPVQVGDVEEAAEHGPRYYIAQYWSLLVDVAQTQLGALATAHGELLSGGPCQGRATASGGQGGGGPSGTAVATPAHSSLGSPCASPKEGRSLQTGTQDRARRWSEVKVGRIRYRGLNRGKGLEEAPSPALPT